MYFEDRAYPIQTDRGVYLKPGAQAHFATDTSAELLHLIMPEPPPALAASMTGSSPGSYAYYLPDLPALLDLADIRERTFAVNQPSVQFGRMQYKKHASSPVHQHLPTGLNPNGSEHFYLIREGNGWVRAGDSMTSVGPGDLVFIPAGEVHQLLASSTGFDYFEFQAPLGFETIMCGGETSDSLKYRK
jgi:quercetin dioxygenase-like cupin family protein